MYDYFPSKIRLFLLVITLCTSPRVMYVASTDEPPALTKGKVIPITGTIARHIHKFSKVCTIITAETPAQIKRARRGQAAKCALARGGKESVR